MLPAPLVFSSVDAVLLCKQPAAAVAVGARGFQHSVIEL